MAKVIEIQTPSWLERHPVQIRRALVRLIFSEAAQYGWQVRMHGLRWRDDDAPSRPAKPIEPMSDEEWAAIMGHVPS